VAKAGGHHLIISATDGLMRHEIRVSVMEPGRIDTAGERTRYSDEALSRESANRHFGRLGTPRTSARRPCSRPRVRPPTSPGRCSGQRGRIHSRTRLDCDSAARTRRGAGQILWSQGRIEYLARRCNGESILGHDGNACLEQAWKIPGARQYEGSMGGCTKSVDSLRMP
jgi:hypothetical protein